MCENIFFWVTKIATIKQKVRQWSFHTNGAKHHLNHTTSQLSQHVDNLLTGSWVQWIPPLPPHCSSEWPCVSAGVLNKGPQSNPAPLHVHHTTSQLIQFVDSWVEWIVGSVFIVWGIWKHTSSWPMQCPCDGSCLLCRLAVAEIFTVGGFLGCC